MDQNIISQDDCQYWKLLTAEYLDNEKRKLEENSIINKQWNCIKDITNEIEYEKRILREIKSKVFELEKFFPNFKLNNENDTLVINEFGIFETKLSRRSPYPETNIKRFPLPKKYISWQIEFYIYDPVTYTKTREEFPPDQLPFLDEDILIMKIKSFYDKNLLNTMPIYNWNGEQYLNNNLIDRKSWQTLKSDNQKTIKYCLEDNFLPLNPSGRTGIRGKGKLFRWGPNHHCVLIIAQLVTNTKQMKILLEREKQSQLQLIMVCIMKQNGRLLFNFRFFHFR